MKSEDLILQKLNEINSQLELIKADIKEIKEDISKIKKFVATENANFSVYLGDAESKIKEQ